MSSSLPQPRGPVRSDFSFGTVIDAGNFVSPGDDVTTFLQNNWNNDTLIQFPAGTYHLGGKISIDPGPDNFGIEGLGNTPEDVVFTIPAGRTPHTIFVGHAGAHLFSNLSFHHGYETDNVFSTRWGFDSDSLFVDVHWLGTVPLSASVGTLGVETAIGATTEGAVVTLRRCEKGVDHYAVPSDYPGGIAYLFAVGAGYGPHNGEVELVDCQFEGANESSMRLDNSGGCLSVYGGTFRNNQNTQIRTAPGLHPTKKSRVVSACCIIDNLPGPPDNMACDGISVDMSGDNSNGLLVQDVEIDVSTNAYGGDMLKVPGWGDQGRVTIRDCRFRSASDGQVDYVLFCPDSGFSNDEITVEGGHFTGWGQMLVEGRPGSSITDACISSNISIDPDWSLTNVSRSGCLAPQGTCSFEGGSGPSPTPTWNDPGANTLAFIGNANGQSYSFSVDGDVVATGDIEFDDAVTHSGGHNYLVTGEVGSGFADTWEVSGTITSMSLGDITLELNGVTATQSDVVNAGTAAGAALTDEIDSFNDGSLLEYTGDLTSFGFTATTQEGPYALDASLGTGTGQDVISTAQSASTGLLNYPSPGDTWQFWFRMPSSAGAGMAFGVSDIDNLYHTYISASDVAMHKRVGGVNTKLGDIIGSFTAGNWYRMVYSWSADARTLSVQAYTTGGTKVLDGSITDDLASAAHTASGVGWHGQAGIFDAARITQTGGPITVDAEAAVPQANPSSADVSVVAVGSGGVIDNFDGSALVDYNIGDHGAWAVTSEAARSGDGLRKIDAEDRRIISTGGLPNYPQFGQTFQWFQRYNGNTIDRFEDGDISEYNYGPGLTHIQITATDVWEGVYGLEFTGGPGAAWSLPGEGFQIYPEPGMDFQFRVQPNGTNGGIRFASAGTDTATEEHYGVNVSNEQVSLVRIDTTGFQTLGSTTFGTPAAEDDWLLCTVEWWRDGTIKVEVFEEGTVGGGGGASKGAFSVTDPNPLPGRGFGVRSAAAGLKLDDIRLQPSSLLEGGGMIFGAVDGDNYYRVHARRDGVMRVRDIAAGSIAAEYQTTHAQLTVDTWYRYEVEWTGSDTTLRGFEVGSDTAFTSLTFDAPPKDDPLASDGVGWGGGPYTEFDDATLGSITVTASLATPTAMPSTAGIVAGRTITAGVTGGSAAVPAATVSGETAATATATVSTAVTAPAETPRGTTATATATAPTATPTAGSAGLAFSTTASATTPTATPATGRVSTAGAIIATPETATATPTVATTTVFTDIPAQPTPTQATPATAGVSTIPAPIADVDATGGKTQTAIAIVTETNEATVAATAAPVEATATATTEQVAVDAPRPAITGITIPAVTLTGRSQAAAIALVGATAGTAIVPESLSATAAVGATAVTATPTTATIAVAEPATPLRALTEPALASVLATGPIPADATFSRGRAQAAGVTGETAASAPPTLAAPRSRAASTTGTHTISATVTTALGASRAGQTLRATTVGGTPANVSATASTAQAGVAADATPTTADATPTTATKTGTLITGSEPATATASATSAATRRPVTITGEPTAAEGIDPANATEQHGREEFKGINEAT